MFSSSIAFDGQKFDILSDEMDFSPLPEGYVHLLLSFVRDTYEYCTYHRVRMDRAGIDLASIRSLEDFWRIPLLTTQDVNLTPSVHLLPDSFRETLLSAGPAALKGEQRIVRIAQSTTSSGGNPKLSYYTKADWDVSCSMWTRLSAPLPAQHITRVLNCFHPGHGAGRYIEEALPRCGSLVLNRHHASSSVEQAVAQLATGFKDLGGFNCIAAPAWSPNPQAKGISLDALLNADIDNFIGGNIRILITAGAPLDVPELRIRERVREANDLVKAKPTRFYEFYGGSEVGIAAASCEAEQLHFFYGAVFGEVVDPNTGWPVPNNGRGRIALTSVRCGSRYLRYLVGDEATVRRERCECGRVTPRIENIQRVVEPERLQSGCAAGGN